MVHKKAFVLKKKKKINTIKNEKKKVICTLKKT